MNVPRKIRLAMETGLATLHELQTVYSLRDLYDILEVAAVRAHNRRVAEDEAIERAKNHP